MINKPLAFVMLSLIFLVSCADGEKEKYDTRAIQSLDEISDTIGELASASYTLNTVKITTDGNESYAEHDVYMRGPDKLYIHSTGSNGNKAYWYDGKTFSYFSFDKNKYAAAEAPSNIIETIEALHNKFGIDFPASDFFYPSLTDDIIAEYDQLLFSDEVAIDDKTVNGIYASNDSEILRIWMDKTSKLPLKFSIESKINPGKFYAATFSNFRSNPSLPDLMFEFKPPSGAEKTILKPIK